MSSASNQQNAAPAAEHCQRLPVGDTWQDQARPEGRFEVTGNTLTMGIEILARDEVRESAEGSRGEEVAAVLEGEFEIDAAGEHYRLATGEAILIPPHEARRFACRSARGVLYRAAVATAGASNANDEEAAQ
ncbi:cupin domain-containing protein [Chitinasiproducens palmae]|uniref:Cupin domain-containing protein n=1 Tax=Chitinasiproducens palmae TaxID=1770053 RepID=A0A1H2PLE7_9BURK|nr:cupin domain-containing protein [Chitinasiproducens palmae]SDV47285.1 Cupin domain-containing protein [Chitinasiproducens palmae]